MGNYLAILKKALKDPKLEGIDCICPSNYPRLTKSFRDLPQDGYVSEWKYGMGEIKYEYHIHRDGVGEQLREAFKHGARGGHPMLTAVYSKEELEKLILNSEVGSGY